MAAYGYFTLLLCFTSNVWAQRSPTITHITQTQIRDVGSQVDLDCSVHYGQDYPVLWVYYDRQNATDVVPLSTNSALIIRDSRLSLRFDADAETYTLSIRELQETDSGWYQCQVITSVSNKITAEVELRVRRPPVVSLSSNGPLVASEGETSTLSSHPQNQSDDEKKPLDDDISHPQNQSDCEMCSQASVGQVPGEGSRLCIEKLLVKAMMHSALAAEKQAEADMRSAIAAEKQAEAQMRSAIAAEKQAEAETRSAIAAEKQAEAVQQGVEQVVRELDKLDRTLNYRLRR